MAEQDYRRLDDNEIVKLVDDNVRTSTGYSSSDLSKEREKVFNTGQLPRPAHDGNSNTFLRLFSMRYSRCLRHCSKHSQLVTAL